MIKKCLMAAKLKSFSVFENMTPSMSIHRVRKDGKSTLPTDPAFSAPILDESIATVTLQIPSQEDSAT